MTGEADAKMEPVDGLPMNPATEVPKERGLYVRDWRGTDVVPASDRRLSVDLWEPVSRTHELWPGVWYVWPGWNDATRQQLPWRDVMEEERERFLVQNPAAKKLS